jgi:signal transduction histidine kinase
MSIRAKIRSILLLGLVLAGGVSALVHVDRLRLTDTVDGLVDHSAAALSLDARMGSTLLAARRAQEGLIDSDDSSLLSDALASATRLIELARSGEALGGPPLSTRYASLARRAAAYREALSGLAPMLTRGKEALSSLRADLAVESESLLAALERVGQASSGGRGRVAAERRRAIRGLIGRLSPRVTELRRLGEAGASRHRGTSVPGSGVKSGRVAVRALMAEWQGLARGAEGHAAVAAAERRLATFLRTLERGGAEASSLRGSIEDHRAQLETVREVLVAGAAAVHRANLSAIDGLRREAVRRADESVARVLGLMGAGALLVVGLGLSLSGSVARRLGRLTDAAGRILRGEVGVRLPTDGSDELAEMAASFNHMSETVRTQHARQGDLNRIISILNAAVGTDELFDRALGAIALACEAAFGAAYVLEDDGQTLRLVASHPRERGPGRPLKLSVGEGISGKVAEERRMMRVTDVDEADGSRAEVGGEDPTRDVLVLPLLLADELIGVVELARPERFPEDLLPFIEEALAQLAVAAGTAKAYETVRRTASVLEEQGRSLRLVNVELGRASELKSEFLATVSHELRTPLNSIIGFTDLVLDDTPNLPERRRRNLETVLRNAKQLMSLIDDLLDLSSIEAGRVTITPERFRLADLVEECVRVVRPLAYGKDLELVADVAADLPDLQTDRGKLRQIVLNLLGNALKFTESGRVALRGRESDGQLLLAVEDTGIGIAEDEIPRLFQKFRQGDSSPSRVHGGTGLGLSIATDLAGHLGGTLQAESRRAQGSTFTLSIPMVYGGGAGTEDTLDSIDPQQGLESKRVVVAIDDDPRMVIQLRQAVQTAGIEVRSAFTMPEGLDILRNLQAPAVVFDPWRPSKRGGELHRGLEGLETAERVQAIGLALSSDGSRGLVLAYPDGQNGGQEAEELVRSLEAAEDDEQVEALLGERGLPWDEVVERFLSVMGERP